MDAKLKKQLEQLANDPRIHAHVIGIVNRMKEEKCSDLDMMATGIVLTKIMQKRMGSNGIQSV
jgi:hypothetical protein